MSHLFAYVNIIIGTAFAVYIEGPCPDVKPVENFNLSMFVGSWYQVARYQNDFEDGNCIILDVHNENDSYTFELNYFSPENIRQIKGYMTYDTNATGVIDMYSSSFNETEGFTRLPLDFVSVDYDNYVVVYECIFDEVKQKNHVYVFVGTRSPIFTVDTKVKFDTFIKSSTYIDSSLLFWDHYSESCGMRNE